MRMCMGELLKVMCVGLASLILVGCPVGGGGSSSAAGTIVDTEDPGPVVDPEPEVTDPPTQLACTTNMFDVFISWRNVGSYREIRINRDSTNVAVLNGNVESFSETLTETGEHIYRIFAYDEGGMPLSQISCVVETEAVSSVQNISAVYDGYDNQVALSWTLPGGVALDSLRVYRDGTFLEEISGSATAYSEDNPQVGVLSYQVRTVSGDTVSGPATCQVTVTELGQITSLACETDQDTGDISLTWENGENYDAIQVYCGSELLDTLSGSATSHTFDFVAYGIYSFQIRGVFNERQTDLAACQGSVGRLIWDPSYSATGYYVYIWDAADPTPDSSEYVFSVPLSTSLLSLLELYQENVLPETMEATDLKVALAAYDSEGNVSDLTEEIPFTWQVVPFGNLN